MFQNGLQGLMNNNKWLELFHHNPGNWWIFKKRLQVAPDLQLVKHRLLKLKA
jgi:hypothetical protein